MYDAWRKGDAELRARVIEHPILFLQAQAAALGDEVEPQADKEIAAVVDDLGAVAGLCVRARTRLDKHDIAAAGAVQRRTLTSAFTRARAAFGSLSARLEEEVH